MQKENNLKNDSTMAKNIQLIGLLLVFIGAVVIALSMTMGWNNSNLINFGSAGIIIAGLITYIYAGKKIMDDQMKN